jgi:hypothetical protein
MPTHTISPRREFLITLNGSKRTTILVFQSAHMGLVYERVFIRRRCNMPKSFCRKLIPKLSFLQSDLPQ